MPKVLWDRRLGRAAFWSRARNGQVLRVLGRWRSYADRYFELKPARVVLMLCSFRQTPRFLKIRFWQWTIFFMQFHALISKIKKVWPVLRLWMSSLTIGSLLMRVCVWELSESPSLSSATVSDSDFLRSRSLPLFSLTFNFSDSERLISVF